jgi:hypothetical protein
VEGLLFPPPTLELELEFEEEEAAAAPDVVESIDVGREEREEGVVAERGVLELIVDRFVVVVLEHTDV